MGDLSVHLHRLSAQGRSFRAGSCRRGWYRARLDAHMVWVESDALGHHRPEDARVLVGQRHCGDLPARALAQRQGPARDRIASLVRRHHRRLGALHQQTAQIGVAAARDPPELGLAAARVLARRDAAPGTELSAVLELREVVDGGDGRAGSDRDRSPSTVRPGAPRRCLWRAGRCARRTTRCARRARAIARARARSPAAPGCSSRWSRPRARRPTPCSRPRDPARRQGRTRPAGRGCG